MRIQGRLQAAAAGLGIGNPDAAANYVARPRFDDDVFAQQIDLDGSIRKQTFLDFPETFLD